MGTPKARWKRAPRDQRRVASERTAPKARFTRSQRSGNPPTLHGSSGQRSLRPLMIFAGAVALLVSLSVISVIAIGTFVRAQQQYEDLQWRASTYGRPTLPYSTLAPDAGQQPLGTTIPLQTTALPGVVDAAPAQSSGSQFPALLAGDDPRWQHGQATPVNSSFALRSMPTLVNNDPIGTVSQATSCWYATDPGWGIWAQIKLGNATAWVDTTTVKLEAAP